MNCRRGCSSVWSKKLSAGPGDTANRRTKQSHALVITSTSLAAVRPTKMSPFDSDSPSFLYGSAYLQAIYPPPAEATSAPHQPPQVNTSSAAPAHPHLHSSAPPASPRTGFSPLLITSSISSPISRTALTPVFLEAEGGLGTRSWVACKFIPTHSYSRRFQGAENIG